MSTPDSAGTIKEQGQAWLNEALELRAVAVPPPTAHHTVVHERLVEARGNLDRLETLLSLAIMTKTANVARARMLAEAADDAWDSHAEAAQRSRRRADFEGAQERYALWRLATAPERKEARNAQLLADFTADVERRIRLAYYGLDGARQDLLARLTKYLPWENSMER